MYKTVKCKRKHNSKNKTDFHKSFEDIYLAKTWLVNKIRKDDKQ